MTSIAHSLGGAVALMALADAGVLRPETAEDRAREAYKRNVELRKQREADEIAARDASPRYQAAIAKRARKNAARLKSAEGR